jgi:plastocyanin
VVDFAWAAAPDGLHTATLPRTGQSERQARQELPLVVPDGDDGPAQAQVNPAVLAPSSPACGTAADPCAYAARATLNSGALPTNGQGHFFVALDVRPGTTIHFFCLIHLGMSGSLRVAGPGVLRTPRAVVRRRAERQAAADTRAALRAERGADHAAARLACQDTACTRRPRSATGTAAPHVEVAEMLPRTVHVRAGDRVRWVTGTRADIHTVTFRTEEAEALEQVCERRGGDAPAGPPPPCGSDPSRLELHFNPQPAGPGTIPSPPRSTHPGSSGHMARRAGCPATTRSGSATAEPSPASATSTRTA